MVAKSIERFGYINPIIVDENGVILAGNTRFRALKLLKFKEAEVLEVTGLSEEDKRGFVIADNRVGEYSKWDETILNQMIIDNPQIDQKFLEEIGFHSAPQVHEQLKQMIEGAHN